MINRRQRLEFALSILPYDHKSVKLSPAQEKVEQIIARLRTDDTSVDEESDDEKTKSQIQNNADGFAEQTMRHIELSENSQQPKSKKVLSTLATLTLAAEKLSKTKCKLEAECADDLEVYVDDSDTVLDEEAALAKIDKRELMENSIQALNEAVFKMLQRWERCKRKALDLLTIEIEKVQAMDQVRDRQAEPFKSFRDGADEHNTSTPKTVDEDDDDEKENETIEVDEDDEDYVPYSADGGGKRKRQQKPVTSTPNTTSKCPRFEFDNDASSKMVTIGPNGTQISRACLNSINWSMTGPAITRKLLCEVFDRATLAFHTLSGKPSPAFKDCARPSKQPLDPLKVGDLVYLMTNCLKMTPREVRTAITTKCADENKMLRTRLQRRPRKTL